MQKTFKGKEDGEDAEEGEALAIWDCGSPLYDSYELVSVTHIIDRHLMALPHLGGSKRFITRSFSPANNMVASMVSNSTRENYKESAVVTTLEKFDARKLWKIRKMDAGGGRKENPKNTKTWLSAFLERIGFRKKRNMHT